MAQISGKLTQALVRSRGPERHADGNGRYLVVDPSGARRWIVRLTVTGQKNGAAKPLRADFASGAQISSPSATRGRGPWSISGAHAGLHPKFNATREPRAFEEIARQVHVMLLPTWKNLKHARQWINTLAADEAAKIMVENVEGAFVRSGFSRDPFATGARFNEIIRAAVAAMQMPEDTPHSFRRALAKYGEEIRNSMERLKAPSMNLGREHLATTVNSDIPVWRERHRARSQAALCDQT